MTICDQFLSGFDRQIADIVKDSLEEKVIVITTDSTPSFIKKQAEGRFLVKYKDSLDKMDSDSFDPVFLRLDDTVWYDVGSC